MKRVKETMRQTQIALQDQGVAASRNLRIQVTDYSSEVNLRMLERQSNALLKLKQILAQSMKREGFVTLS